MQTNRLESTFAGVPSPTLCCSRWLDSQTGVHEQLGAQYRRLGVLLEAPMAMPECDQPEAYVAESATGLGLQRRPTTAYKSEEQRLREEQMQKFSQFLRFDKKVLRFFGVLKSSYDDGTSERFDNLRFSLMYYLADGTIEAVSETRSGTHKSSTLFVKRCRLAKNWRDVHRGQEPVYITEQDLHVGKTVDVFGREIILLSCDAFTKTFYKDTYQLDQHDISMPAETQQAHSQNASSSHDRYLVVGPDSKLQKNAAAPNKTQRNKGRTLRFRLQIDSKDRYVSGKSATRCIH